MIIGKNTKQTNDVKIEIDNEEIEIVNEFKYLGVILDDKLEMNSNINYICKKNKYESRNSKNTLHKN